MAKVLKLKCSVDLADEETVPDEIEFEFINPILDTAVTMTNKLGETQAMCLSKQSVESLHKYLGECVDAYNNKG